MLRFGTKGTKTRGAVLPAQAVQTVPACHSLPRFSVTEQTFQPSVHICQWVLLPVLIRAVSEFFQTSSLTGCFALLSGCGEEFYGPSGSFHSPGYPNRYPSNRECIWYIHTAPGSSIQLTIHEFDIEYHPNCSYDVLEVRALVLLL